MLRGVCIGAGYFSRFQYEAWNRMPNVTITALCNRHESRAKEMADAFGIPAIYSSIEVMLEKEKPDFLDIITPPETHLEFCRLALERGIPVVCQKPLAPTLADATKIVALARQNGVPFMVHENFRFQPWYREIKKLLQQRAVGDVIFSASFLMRMGDGWGTDAYLDRQPYFRNMPRLLVYETGIHFIDTFRYLFGEVNSVYAQLRKLNPVIEGEDSGFIHFNFGTGAWGLWDASRYNEPNYANPRYTFGNLLVDGNGGTLRLYPDGKITIQKLGELEAEHFYEPSKENFAGDCVFVLQQHFVQKLLAGESFETNGEDYLRNILVQEAVYESSERKQLVTIDYSILKDI